MRMLSVPAILALALASDAWADPVAIPSSGLQVELPAGWTTSTEAGHLVASRPDGTATLSFEVIDEADADTYVEEWAEGVPGLTDLQVELDSEVEEVNGLEQLSSMGQATIDGEDVQWDLKIVRGDRMLAVLAFGQDLDGTEVQDLYASVAAVPGGQRPPARKGSAASTNDDPPIIPDYDPGN